jgi:hypothetical protein
LSTKQYETTRRNDYFVSYNLLSTSCELLHYDV